MPRVCTVCAHRKRAEIDAALSKGNESYREIARRFSLSVPALDRHKNGGHISAAVQRSAQAREDLKAVDLVAEVSNALRHVRRLQDACHRYLLDEATGEYDLSPKTNDVWVRFEENKGGRQVRRRARLSTLLQTIEEKLPTVKIERGELKVADPRELILRASSSLDSHVRLLGELAGQLQTQNTGSVNVAILAPLLIGAIADSVPAEYRLNVRQAVARRLVELGAEPTEG